MKKKLILCGILIVYVCVLISCSNKEKDTTVSQESVSANAHNDVISKDENNSNETLPTVPPDTSTEKPDEKDDSNNSDNKYDTLIYDYSTEAYEDMITYLHDKIENEDAEGVDDVVKNAPLIVPRIKQDMSEQVSFKGALEFVGIYRFSFRDSAENTFRIAIRRGVADFNTYIMRNEDVFCVDTEDLSYNISYNYSSDTWSVYIDHTIININFPKSIHIENCFEMLEEFSKYFELCDLTSRDEIVELEMPEWWIDAKTNPLVLSDVSE